MPIPAVNRLESGAATGNLADPGKIIRPASPALSRGNLLATSFPLKEDSGTFVKETLSTQSKDVLVGWAKGAKEAVATEHAVSEAPRGRSWTALGDCVSPLGIASLGPLHGHTAHILIIRRSIRAHTCRASADTDYVSRFGSAGRPHLYTCSRCHVTSPLPSAGKMVSKRMRCLALISHNNMKPAMQARLSYHTHAAASRTARTLTCTLNMHMHMRMCACACEAAHH